MTLVDTSVWVDHFRRWDIRLSEMLEQRAVAIHPFVVGELACGHIPNRAEVLTNLSKLTSAPVATDREVLKFVDSHKLMARGIGYIDAHLLAATVLGESLTLLTRDRRLRTIAEELELAYRAAD